MKGRTARAVRPFFFIGENMITLYDFKRFAGIGDTKSDSHITSAVLAAIAVAKQYTGRDYSAADKIKKLNPPPSLDYLVLPNTNVSAVKEVKFLDEILDPAAYFLEDDGTLEFVDTTLVLPSTPRSIQVTYVTESVAPADLKLACLELATYYWKREYNLTKQIQGQDVDFRDDNILPTQVKTIFDLHRCL